MHTLRVPYECTVICWLKVGYEASDQEHIHGWSRFHAAAVVMDHVCKTVWWDSSHHHVVVACMHGIIAHLDGAGQPYQLPGA